MSTTNRPRFTDLPEDVRLWAARALGGPITDCRPVSGGRSPGPTEIVRTADGTAGFLKAVHPDLNPGTPGLLRAELRALGSMPAGLPIGALIDGLDHGPDGWVALLIEYVPGEQAPLPWTRSAVTSVLQSLTALADALTPAPPGDWQAAEVALEFMFGAWPSLSEATDLDPWVRDRLPRLAELAAEALAAAAGDTLLHLDLRADNMMLRPDGGMIVVDWAWASRGAAWLDPALLAIEFISTPGPGLDVDRVLAGIAEAHGISERWVVGALIGMLAFFESAGRQPDPPGLPTLRAFQRFQGDALRTWLRNSPLAARVIAD